MIDRWRLDYNQVRPLGPPRPHARGRAPPVRGRPAAQPRPVPPGARYHRRAEAAMNNQDFHCRRGTDGEHVIWSDHTDILLRFDQRWLRAVDPFATTFSRIVSKISSAMI